MYIAIFALKSFFSSTLLLNMQNAFLSEIVKCELWKYVLKEYHERLFQVFEFNFCCGDVCKIPRVKQLIRLSRWK